jgi:TfoX N-terminal domain
LDRYESAIENTRSAHRPGTLRSMKSSDRFRDFVLDQLSAIRDVRTRAMFGGIGIYAGDVFFGLIASDVIRRRESRPGQVERCDRPSGQLPLEYLNTLVLHRQLPRQNLFQASRRHEVQQRAPDADTHLPGRTHNAKLRRLRFLTSLSETIAALSRRLNWNR